MFHTDALRPGCCVSVHSIAYTKLGFLKHQHVKHLVHTTIKPVGVMTRCNSKETQCLLSRIVAGCSQDKTIDASQ